MKKPIYLFVLASLSFISSLWRFYGAFFGRYVPNENVTTGDPAVNEILKGTAAVSERAVLIQTNMVNKFLAVLMLGLVITVFVFLFKKLYKKAGWTYVAYLGTTLLSTIYTFLMTRNIHLLVNDVTIQQSMKAGYLFAMFFNLAIFFVFLGITLYNLLKKSKEKPVDNNQSGLV